MIAFAKEIYTSTVELEGALEQDNGGSVTTSDGGVKLLEGLVEIGDIGLVVLLVVQPHDLAGDSRLQGVVTIGKIRD